MQQINHGLRGRVEEECRLDLRKIDSLVAEKVMGWRLDETNFIDYWVGEHDGRGGDWAIAHMWKPTTNIQDAWEVVKKLNEKFTVDIRDTLNDGAECYLYEFHEETESLFLYTAADGETAPLAICLAALKAVGVEVEVDG